MIGEFRSVAQLLYRLFFIGVQNEKCVPHGVYLSACLPTALIVCLPERSIAGVDTESVDLSVRVSVVLLECACVCVSYLATVRVNVCMCVCTSIVRSMLLYIRSSNRAIKTRTSLGRQSDQWPSQ